MPRKVVLQSASQRLAEWRKQHIGVFDTGLKCNCGSNIHDHAKETTSRTTVGLPKYGPRPDYEQMLMLGELTVGHQYECPECGALYSNAVIEGKRGYVPRDKRK